MSALPFGPPIEPMLARSSEAIPDGDGWLYEPKWDGFRTLVFYDGTDIYLQSRDLKPMGRYFPELVAGLREVLQGPVVLDGEVVVMGDRGLEFETLQMRIHPAESRVRRLSQETPASFVAFDLLAEGDDDLRAAPFEERHRRVVALTEGTAAPLSLTPSTLDASTAQDWFERFEGAGFDGVVAKRLDGVYQPGVRAMLKIKHLRTADCVVAGFRWLTKHEGEAVGSLLLGLYDEAGVLHHVGHTSSFTMAKKRELAGMLEPYVSEDGSEGFGGGRTPGAPSRWSSGKDVSWVRLRPELVCEVSFDHLQGDRFRHGTTFQRWRADKPPEACTYDQLDTAPPAELQELLREVRGSR
jgi:ATP-dependent DNA ligase